MTALRKNHVPSYLFRAWHVASGGAPSAALNTSTAIVPQLFMHKDGAVHGDTRPDFYELLEEFLYQIATDHRHWVKTPSGFTSWAASLHAVLCYTRWMKHQNLGEPHVAVMDTHDLDDEVLVWHAPHLGIGAINHEYLAFGISMGNGYRPVSLSALECHGIDNILPENCGPEIFGDTFRANMFQAPTTDIWQTDLDAFRVVGSLFGNLAFPVATALAYLRPRIWRNWRQLNGEDAQWPISKEAIVKWARDLKMDYAPDGLHEAPWLAIGMVRTNGFPDVEQWIGLVAMFADYLPHRQPLPSRSEQTDVAVDPEEAAVASTGHIVTADRGRKRKQDENEDDERSAKRIATATAMTLRKRKSLIYRTCRGPKCGRCMACRAV
jgi:hypothetical protein